jgi:hypothetical protein
VLVGALAAATARGEVVALIDTHDRFDPAGAAAREVDLSRLLWVRERGDAARALKALNLVVQAGGFGVVAFDLADVPPRAVRQFPHTTWLRLSRVIEGSQTVLLLLGSERIARSSSGASIALEGEAGARARWAGQGDRARHLIGLEITPRASRFHLRAARYGGQAGEADSAIARSHVAPASALRATARQAPPALRASTFALRATVDKPARQA